MADNSEDSFITPSSPPWYQKIPMPIWVALIGALATIFAAGIQSGWFTRGAQPALAEPTAIVEPETAARATKECPSYIIHPDFKLVYETHKDALRCQDDTFNEPIQLGEQLFEGGHIFWMIGKGERMFVVFDQSKATGADLPTGEWFSTIGPRNNPYPEDLHDTEDKYPDGIGLLAPSSDLQEPVGGMGWLWRTHLGGADGDLGWARDKAREHVSGEVGLYQDFEWGFMFKGSDPKVYVLLDTGTFFAERPVE